jgi:WhiB family transcriptional regulator, redox-sensing transcriptional regulator
VQLADDGEASAFRWRVAPDWSDAACKSESGVLTGLFFSPEVADIARAKAICFGCPLKHDCLAGAIDRREPCGVWGGELVVDGRIIAHKRGRGRPRKTEAASSHLQVVS